MSESEIKETLDTAGPSADMTKEDKKDKGAVETRRKFEINCDFPATT